MDAVGAGSRQLVILGAGLDTRAFRLDLPADTVVWEVEVAEMVNFKERVSARGHAGCRRP